ncbi:uncharacterized protein LOC131161552 [Malania oleifera]|uniref:uncharacterized protein LOC131161552 n=1 Tax=Malania oleifera TaxID=397392 RepID=UPI0025AEAD55|nr:uncharacterized protein LOC131161552 [Malania oleifera]
MDSDDDYQHFSSQEPSPSVQGRQLKRLKKAPRVSKDPPSNPSHEAPLNDSSRPEALASSKARDFEDSNEPLQSEFVRESFDGESGSNSGSGDTRSDADHVEVRRALEFDSAAEEFDGIGEDRCGETREISDLKNDSSDSRKRDSEGSEEKKKKKKRVKTDGDGEGKKSKSSASTKRTEKERKAYLHQLHAESQRLLRETRDATFKPIPLVQKPISSVLEKIRKRKLEVSKKTIIVNSNCSNEEKIMIDLDSKVPSDESGDGNFGKANNKNMLAHQAGIKGDLDASEVDASNESVAHSNHEAIPSMMDLDEESKHAFRAPLDDTQDLFSDSQASDTKDERPNEQCDNPIEEVLAPSLLTMNLKLDSAPPDDDVSSDDEDSDKENIDPGPLGPVNSGSAPNGDPIKAFVDDEAVEEDDSDHDLFRFQDSEEEDNGDAEELDDLIVTGFEEKSTDKERRNQLHQQWLEQQDAAGTENLLQRLKCAPKLRETTLLEDEEDEDKEVEEFSDEDAEHIIAENVAQINGRKLKQMIPQMFNDKDDTYLSSDDEESEKILIKQRVLQKAEEQVAFLSPSEDENSREVFGLIKKLNIVPDTRKKAKTSSFLDAMLVGRNSYSSSKSSFLGRVSSHSLSSSSHKQGSSTARAFIFGRDDSNSRNSISISDDSSDKIEAENHSARNASAKFTYSQSKSSAQNKKVGAKTMPGASLFEILRRSSFESNNCTQDNLVGVSEAVFSAFKCAKKSIKTERT